MVVPRDEVSARYSPIPEPQRWKVIPIPIPITSPVTDSEERSGVCGFSTITDPHLQMGKHIGSFVCSNLSAEEVVTRRAAALPWRERCELLHSKYLYLLWSGAAREGRRYVLHAAAGGTAVFLMGRSGWVQVHGWRGVMCKLSVGREGEGDLSGITRSGLSGKDIEAPSYVGDLSFTVRSIHFNNSHYRLHHFTFPQYYNLFLKKKNEKQTSLLPYSLLTHSPRLLLLENPTAFKSWFVQLLTSPGGIRAQSSLYMQVIIVCADSQRKVLAEHRDTECHFPSTRLLILGTAHPGPRRRAGAAQERVLTRGWPLSCPLPNSMVSLLLNPMASLVLNPMVQDCPCSVLLLISVAV